MVVVMPSTIIAPKSLKDAAISFSGRAAIDQYLTDADSGDDDFVTMRRLILEEGLSAYAAVQRVVNDSQSLRRPATLRYHASGIVEDIYRVLCGGFERHIEELGREGSTAVPNDAAPILRRMVADLGLTVSEMTEFKVAS